MKKVFVILIVFLSINLILSGSDHGFKYMVNLPGIPVLHNKSDNQPTAAQKATQGVSNVNSYIRHNSADNNSYKQYFIDIDNGELLSPGNNNTSQWIRHNLVSRICSQIQIDSFQVGSNSFVGQGTIDNNIHFKVIVDQITKDSPCEKYISKGHYNTFLPLSYFYYIDRVAYDNASKAATLIIALLPDKNYTLPAILKFINQITEATRQNEKWYLQPAQPSHNNILNFGMTGRLPS